MSRYAIVHTRRDSGEVEAVFYAEGLALAIRQAVEYVRRSRFWNEWDAEIAAEVELDLIRDHRTAGNGEHCDQRLTIKRVFEIALAASQTKETQGGAG